MKYGTNNRIGAGKVEINKDEIAIIEDLLKEKLMDLTPKFYTGNITDKDLPPYPCPGMDKGQKVATYIQYIGSMLWKLKNENK